jgi:enamine deaminase RidA (YjgF/YER057c/UK114 family)
MSKQAIQSPDAPAAIGPYSQAIRAGDTLYLSGQIPLDPTTMQIVDGSTAASTRRRAACSTTCRRSRVRRTHRSTTS